MRRRCARALHAPPESEWKGNDGTINIIRNTLGVHYGTVHDVLLRCTAAEENKMNVDVGERFSNGDQILPRQHRRRQPGAHASRQLSLQ